MTPTPEHLSALQLDALGLGALPPEARARAQAHLSACERCRTQAGALAEHKERFSREVLPRTAPGLRARHAPPRRWALLGALAVPALAAVGLAILVVRMPGTGLAEAEPVLAAKGGPLLQVYAHRGERVWRPAEGEALAAGDQVRFRVEAGELPYLLLASVDGAGQVSVYFPFGGERSARVPSAEGGELPGSVVLDEAAGPERLFALFSRQPLAAADVRAALRRVAAGGPSAIRTTRRLPMGAEAQATFLFEKATP